uniref:non-specific serine/threonine protein kinase n=1 Tax=Chlamydomonas euryale TaxID=1486919 RepID=A0A7R9YZB3_9CHLO
MRAASPVVAATADAAPSSASRPAVATQLPKRDAGAASSSSAVAAARDVAAYMEELQARADARRILEMEIDDEHSRALPGYSVGKVIGEGGFCMVRIGVHHASRRKVAIKVVDRQRLTDPNEAKRMQREIRVMKHLCHECVVRLFEVVETEKILYLVMEHAPNGSLLDFVRARKRMREGDAAHALQQIVSGLDYCHQHEVVHRDIKLENILLDASNRMKLIDFGLSAFYIVGKKLKVHCGSPSYAAPEIVARKHYDGPPVDVWSLGVVLFAMLAGYLPFHTSNGNKQELCGKIMEGKYSAPETVSPAARDLLQRMLTVDPAKRITLPDVLLHPWVQAAPKWEPTGGCIYDVSVDPRSGSVRANEHVLASIARSGLGSRTDVLQALLRGEANTLTAHYYLLAEADEETQRERRRLGGGDGGGVGGGSGGHLARRARSVASPSEALADLVAGEGGAATAAPRQVVVL